MARCYGEGFQQPVDFMTGAPISGAPHIGMPSNNAPKSSGMVVLRPEPAEMENTSQYGRPMDPPTIDQPRVGW